MMNGISENKKGILYVVATPIGNLEDITLRALRILREVDLIAAEDTRQTRKLLEAYNISASLISLHEHNEKLKSSSIVERIKAGKNVAYVSDAGTPCISDPGYYLISLAQSEEIKIVPVPGVSAVITAMSVCGFPADEFIFCGFLSARQNKRRQALELLKKERRTIIIYESPMRILSTLEDILIILGDREVVIARELTKMFEEIKRGRISPLLKNSNQLKTKGEFTIIIKGAEEEQQKITDEEIEKSLRQFLENNEISMRDAVAEVVAMTGLPKNRIYKIAVKVEKKLNI
ncbi:MAG TPA: 16S rRNA (cytidine(1402)-2'-O)-methyltransferase [Smithellaceae bacterium]|nr:16S rRNA (cytidine(1402)-2'-O)-methyltransferase [Smithellaceae bacterium]